VSTLPTLLVALILKVKLKGLVAVTAPVMAPVEVLKDNPVGKLLGEATIEKLLALFAATVVEE
jgi:hypothetical protein